MFLFYYLIDLFKENINQYLVYMGVIFGPFIILWFLSLLSAKHERVVEYRKIVLIVPMFFLIYFIFKIMTDNSTGWDALGAVAYYFAIIYLVIQLVLLLFLTKILKRENIIKMSKNLKNIVTIAIILFVISCVGFSINSVKEKDSLNWILTNDTRFGALIYKEKVYYLDSNNKLTVSNLSGDSREILLSNSFISIQAIGNDEVYLSSDDIENAASYKYYKYNINTKKLTEIYKAGELNSRFVEVAMLSGNLDLYKNKLDLVDSDNRPVFVYDNAIYEADYQYISKRTSDANDDGSIHIEEESSVIRPLAIKNNLYYFAVLTSGTIIQVKVLDLDTNQIIKTTEFNVNGEGDIEAVFDDEGVAIISNYDNTLFKYNYSDNKITIIKKLTEIDNSYNYEKYLFNNKLILKSVAEDTIEVIDLNTSLSQVYHSKFGRIVNDKLYYLKGNKIETINL